MRIRVSLSSGMGNVDKNTFFHSKVFEKSRMNYKNVIHFFCYLKKGMTFEWWLEGRRDRKKNCTSIGVGYIFSYIRIVFPNQDVSKHTLEPNGFYGIISAWWWFWIVLTKTYEKDRQERKSWWILLTMKSVNDVFGMPLFYSLYSLCLKNSALLRFPELFIGF